LIDSLFGVVDDKNPSGIPLEISRKSGRLRRVRVRQHAGPPALATQSAAQLDRKPRLPAAGRAKKCNDGMSAFCVRPLDERLQLVSRIVKRNDAVGGAQQRRRRRRPFEADKWPAEKAS
jgi:hypothetical protein